MKKSLDSIICCLIFCICLTSQISAQSYNPLNPPNSYRSSTNPYYWKNKMPQEGYWQQDVHYRINAEIDERTDIITATEELTYWNNSPDDLTEIFFHLYQNAFQPGSYYDKFQTDEGKKNTYGERYESKGLGTVVSNLTITYSNGMSYSDLDLYLDNTILRITLPAPLRSGESLVFNMDFKTYFDAGTVRRRMKVFNAYNLNEPRSKTDPDYDYNDYANKHYDGVHWYPRISVYDRKFGWTTDQHLRREFYGDFGTYDVNLTFASHMVVEATGYLQNRSQVLPSDLREKLDLKNFATKKWNSKPSVVTAYKRGEKKTWSFHAENVHDFAFTADPTYRIGESEWKGIKTVAIVREHHASGWQNAAEYTAKIIKTFSEDMGPYVYHKMIVADAKDGMEYPMLTLDGGADPGYRGLLVHEVGHNWFFGMLGNNETYRAAMDEGFTQFLTVWGLEAIDGKHRVKNKSKSPWINKYKDPEIVLDSRAYASYLRDATRGIDPHLNTHSHEFESTSAYRHVYVKMATMLYNLQYVLGDELFLKVMQNYVTDWTIAHPYFEDFRASVARTTKTDMNWFFDQWMEDSKSIDYAINSVKPSDKGFDYYDISFSRNGGMQMPIDFTVESTSGVSYDFHIPNRWFVKDTKAEVLPRWEGFGDLEKSHTTSVYIPGGIYNVQIDPSYRLADINYLNNSKRFPIKTVLDAGVYNPASRYEYVLKWRPDVWYNSYDGVKLGARLKGNYFNYKHKLDAGVWLNTRLLQNDIYSREAIDESSDLNNAISILARYRTPIDNFLPNSEAYAEAKYHVDGINGFTAGLERKLDKHSLGMEIKGFQRKDNSDLLYPLFDELWESDKWDNSMNLLYSYQFRNSANRGSLNLKISTPLFSEYDHSYTEMEVLNRSKYEKLDVKMRAYARIGTGTASGARAMYLAGANPEQLIENKYTRSLAFFPEDWASYGHTNNHFHHGGGMNMRGYSGYLGAYLGEDGNVYNYHTGRTGLALNTEFEFDKYLPSINLGKLNSIKKWLHLDTYVFADAGVISYDTEEKMKFTNLIADAGIGLAATVKRFGVLQTVKPLTVRMDFPLLLSRTPFDDPSHFQYRWLIGFGRAF